MRIYFQIAHLLPESRVEGLRECMVYHNERRARAIASFHSGAGGQWIETYTNAEENHWKALIERFEYKPAWYLYGMVRPLAGEIPELPLPAGVEVRPVRKEDLWKIWRVAREAFKDGREYSEERWSKKRFENRNRSRTFDPTLWQIAWEGDEVVGGIHNYIDPEENEAFERLWGHTELIFVRRAWRGKGIAKGLIARSFRILRQRGMESAVLDVDSENPSGALGLYESLGYKPYAEFIFYRKPVA
jgi:ribosomal protein S18 acetylase RimI-like enzyme